MVQLPIPLTHLLSAGIRTIYRCISEIKRHSITPDVLRLVKIPGTNKVTLEIDLLAERLCRTSLNELFGEEKILSVGEESIAKHNDFSNENRIVALIDAIDGTELFALGFSNWCSAIIFFYPPTKKILASLIGFPSGNVYYTCETPKCIGVYKLPYDKSLLKKIMDDRQINLCLFKRQHLLKSVILDTKSRGIHVCFYGQKLKNLLPFIQNPLIKRIRALEKLLKRKQTRFRIYNLGGNPMMIRIAERKIDVVFEFSGQRPHDVAPGAYIAIKMGCFLKDLNGNNINLESVLLKPNERIKYILYRNKGLFKTLLDIGKKTLTSDEV